MIVFPAVDILDGTCVQLVQGDRKRATKYGDPVERALQWLLKGADHLHVINLNGAFGNSGANVRQIRQIIAETGVFIQLGGGIRSVGDAGRWLDAGVNRIILGTLAIRQPDSISILSEEYGSDRIMAGVDARGGEVVIGGWDVTAGDFLMWAKKFEELGAGSLLFTNVDVEGLQDGIDSGPVKRLIQNTGIPVIAAGGISSLSDVQTLHGIGAAGIVLGSALYSGKIRLEEVIEVCR